MGINICRITRLLLQQSDLAQLSLFCSILLLSHLIRTQFTYFKGHNIGANEVCSDENRGLDYSEKGTKSNI